MYARSTTVRGDPQALDGGIAYVRDTVMPAVQGMAGFVGLSMLADHGSGRSIVTSAWADEAALTRTARGVSAMRARAAEIMGGEAEVREWEIVLLHRMHETHHGACARVIWTEQDPAGMDRMIDAFRASVVPRIEDLPGFCSLSVMVDRGSGRSATAVSYDSRPSMAEAERPGMAMRQEFTGRMGMEVTEVAAFDIALAHLRVPETV